MAKTVIEKSLPLGPKQKLLNSKKRQVGAFYRVFIKEGHKVNAYCTDKICLFGASMGFILTNTCGHLIIYTKDLKYFTLNVI